MYISTGSGFRLNEPRATENGPRILSPKSGVKSSTYDAIL